MKIMSALRRRRDFDSGFSRPVARQLFTGFEGSLRVPFVVRRPGPVER